MLRTLSCVVVVAAALLSGCATTTISRDTGFAVTEKSIMEKRQAPWESNAIHSQVFQEGGVAVAFVPLTDPLPTPWAEEFLDPVRMYQVVLPDGKKAHKPLMRVVERAVFYAGEESIGFYDAVLMPQVNGFFPLVPPQQVTRLQGSNLLVVSSDGNFAVTTLGKTVDLRGVTDLRRLPSGFFRKNPSPAPPFGTMHFGDEYGRMFLTELFGYFSVSLSVNGRLYFAKPDTEIIAAKYTALNHPADRIISCTSLKLGPSVATPAGAIIKGITYADQVITAVTADDCLKAETLLQKIQRSILSVFTK